MRSIMVFLAVSLIRALIWLRYRVVIKGLDKLKSGALNPERGTLFLPNHPGIFVDPLLASIYVYRDFAIRPLITEYMYYTPGVLQLMKFINALPVPGLDIAPNSYKRFRNENTFLEAIRGLRSGENFLFYPAGRTKSTGLEIIGGASGLHRVLAEVPDSNVVLVRMTGLWGSIFSRAASGQPPPLWKTVGQLFKVVLKNGIFFVPRREITIEFHVPDDFPYQSDRVELNKYLEDWYNAPYANQDPSLPAGEPLKLVSYSRWKEELLQIDRPCVEEEERAVDLGKVSNEVFDQIMDELARMTKRKKADLKPSMDLANDLGLDSLDGAEIIAFLEDNFHIGRVHPADLTTVRQLLGIASGQVEPAIHDDPPAEVDMSHWFDDETRAEAALPTGKTIPEVFLRTCDRMGTASACADARTGIMSYADFKLRVLILADKFRDLPGKEVGLMLPSSIGASLLVIALQMAGKTPVMVNWTVGPRHLETVVELSHLEVVLTSWLFMHRLDNVDLTPLHEKILLLEEFRLEIGLKDKLKGKWRARKTADQLIPLMGIDKIHSHDTAGILFTSGTEKAPKGVPLSYANICSNQRATMSHVEFSSEDSILAMLPPFHSFGFTLTGILPLLVGIRVIYSPDPTDGPRLAREIHQYGTKLVVGAPTFLKNIFKATTPEHVKSVKWTLSGAEKCPPELKELIKRRGPHIEFLEGYGVTECSPVVTCQRPGHTDTGVGCPLPGITVEIVHQETHETLSQGERGLILVQGPNVFNGYLPQKGVPSPFISLNGHKWYNTGDLGFIDEKGCLNISGRLKRFVKVGGEMISLTAIETALLEAAPEKGWSIPEEGPALAMSAIEHGHIKAELFLFTRFEVDADAINRTLKEQGFSNLVKISKVFVLDEIPVMGTGKTNYRLLERDHLAGLA